MSDSSTNGTSIVQPSGQLSIVQPEQAIMLYDPTTEARPVWASWNLNTEEGFMLLSRMKHGENKRLGDCINEEILIRNAYTEPRDGIDKVTGEVTMYPLIFLEGADGTVYACASHGVYGSLVDILRHRRQTPWNPPIRVKVVRKMLANARQTYGLLYLGLADSEPDPKKGGKRREA